MANKFQQFQGACSDQLWPGMNFGKARTALVSEHGEVWTWSAEKGLVKNTNLTENNKWKEISSNLPYSLDKKTNTLILNLKPRHMGPPSGDNPPSSGPQQNELASAQCKKAFNDVKTIMSGQKGRSLSNREVLKLIKEPSSFRLNKMRATSRSPNSTLDSTFITGVHESFHIHDQEHWANAPHSSTENRATPYPTPVKPREYRTLIKVALRKALAQNSTAFLQEAAYWYSLYKDQFEDEAQQARVFDAMEGSAEYVGEIANRLNNCPVSQNEFARISKQAILESTSDQPTPSVDTEGYQIGALAGSILDQQGKDWKTALQQHGISPLDYLLKPFGKGSPGALSKSEIHKHKERASVFPTMVDECIAKPNIDHMEAQLKDPNTVWISVPVTSFGSKGLFDTKDIVPGAQTIVDGSMSSSGLRIKNMPMVISNNNPCGAKHAMVLVPKPTNNQLNYSSSSKSLFANDGMSASGNLNIQKQAEFNNKPVLCAQ